MSWGSVHNTLFKGEKKKIKQKPTYNMTLNL